MTSSMCSAEGGTEDERDCEESHPRRVRRRDKQNADRVAAGLGASGKIPFTVTHAAFGSMRMVEIIRREICYPHPNVRIACSHGGATPANNGTNHQCIEDIGILSTIHKHDRSNAGGLPYSA